MFKRAERSKPYDLEERTLQCAKDVRAFVKALQGLVPELRDEDVHPSGSGVRAQALDPEGKLLDDFRIVEADRMIHVLNAPSPAATASISIGRSIAEMAGKSFGV